MSGTREAIETSRGWPAVERVIESWAQVTEAPIRWLDRLIYARDRYIVAARDLVESVHDYLFGLGPDLAYPGWFYDGWLPKLYLRCTRWRERQRFVSTYAMAHPEEDFCETLVAWARLSPSELLFQMKAGPLAPKFRAMTTLVQRYGGRGVDPISCR